MFPQTAYSFVDYSVFITHDGVCYLSKWLTRPLVTKLQSLDSPYLTSNMCPRLERNHILYKFHGNIPHFMKKSIYVHKRQGKIHCAFAYTTISLVWQHKSDPNICINEYKICTSNSLEEKNNLLNHVISQNDEIHMKHSKVLKNHYKKCHVVQHQHGINMNLNSVCFSQYLYLHM